ncbi:10 TM domain-containing transmembrane protein [Acrasis kona]|uniref:10 TM domain-containing transmembrane protein n=1 Tax=Acrasis kona TaxID=1008807 RepID=A0AAW2ZES2_9EUKA
MQDNDNTKKEPGEVKENISDVKISDNDISAQDRMKSKHLVEGSDNETASFDYSASDLTSINTSNSQPHALSRKQFHVKTRSHLSDELHRMPKTSLDIERPYNISVTPIKVPKGPLQFDDIISEDTSINIETAPNVANRSELSVEGEQMGMPHVKSTPSMQRLHLSTRGSFANLNQDSPLSATSVGTPIESPHHKLFTPNQPQVGLTVEDSLAKLKNNTKHGIEEAKAKRILIDSLEEVITAIETESGTFRGRFWAALSRSLFKVNPLNGGVSFCLFVLCTAMLVVACILKFIGLPYRQSVGYSEYSTSIRVLFEAIIMLFSTFIFVLLHVQREYKKQHIYVSLLRVKFKELLKNDFDFAIKSEEGNLFEGINMIPYRLIFVCRDHKWEKLPHILLVKGDYVYTHLRHKDLEESGISYALTPDRGYYLLTETPLKKVIQDSQPNISHYDSNKEVFYARIHLSLNVLSLIALIVFVLTMILNIIRVSVPVGSYDWVYLIFQQPVYVIMCLLPIGFPAMWLAEYTFTSARISTLFQVLTSGTHNIAIVEENKHSHIRIPITLFIHQLYAMIVGKTTLYWEHLLSLGQLTSLCCIDKNGLLADLLYAPEKLLFIKTRETDVMDENHILPSSMVDTYQQQDREQQQELFEEEQQQQQSEPSKQEEQVAVENVEPSAPINKNTTKSSVPDYVTLDITFDRNADDESNVITFEEPDWKDHMNNLRPLGLNALITGCSPLPDFDSVQGMLDAKSHLWKKYMYLLGKEIGFSDNVLDSFAFRKRIHTQFNNLEMSAVIVDYGNGLQIQSFGHPELLIQYCSEYWDGNEIKDFCMESRSIILETFKQWGERRDLYCLALAYKPIDQKYTDVIIKDKDSKIVNVDLKHLDVHHDGDEGDDDGHHEQDLKRAKLYDRAQDGQIYLGMAAFRQQPKRDLEKFIEHMNDCGIRFTIFSKGSAQKTKAFGSKIGLMTDWNACISLAEREDLKMDESDMKAQLPHGIDNIKKHLRDVDDVPLLVPLFSDSEPNSTMNMIQIMQDHHEVVCVVGSSIGVANTPIFVQGNVCLSVDPSSERSGHAVSGVPLRTVEAFDDVEEEQELQEIQEEEPMMDAMRPKNDFEEDFADLFSFPCAFHIKSQDVSFFPILFHLIKESRRMNYNMKQSFTFFLGATMTVLIVQFLTQFCLLPSPLLDGIQCLWIVLVIIPILSFSLLGSQMEPGIMNLISSKGIVRRFKYLQMMLIVTVRFLLPVPVCLVMYVWTFFRMEQSGVTRVGWNIFGGQVDVDVYRSPPVQAAIVYAQNVALFVLVYYFTIMSVSYHHRVHSIFTVVPFRNVLWVFAVIACLLMQVAFCAISMAVVGTTRQVFPSYEFYAYLIVFLLPFVMIVVDELVKIKMRKTFRKNQQRLQLQFGTRLGMYSPK